MVINLSISVMEEGRMDIKKAFEKELMQPMSRREFLARIGGVTLALLGVATVLTSLQRRPPKGVARPTAGYGSSSYGGH
jgi:hypothetical protein